MSSLDRINVKEVEIMSVGEKIRTARKNIAISQGALAKKIDVSLDTISRWEIGKRTPRTEDLLKLSNVLGVSVSYLMGETGNNSPLLAESSAGEANSMSCFGKEALLGKDHLLMIPRISPEVKLSACRGNSYEQTMDMEIIGRYPLFDGRLAALYSEDSLVCIDVEGDSMEPQMHDGDIVIFNRSQDWVPGNIYAVCLEGKILVKGLIDNGRCNPPILRSSNKEYPDIAVRKDQFFLVCGRVLKILTDRAPRPII